MSTLIAAVWPSGWSGLAGLWDRKLTHYPETKARYMYLAVTVVATIVLYYELYVGGAVATQIIADSASRSPGSCSSRSSATRSARSPRSSPVSPTAGAGPTSSSAVCSSPACSSPSACRTRRHKTSLPRAVRVLSFVEGIVLVATPALIRDFSPQVGRGAAMGFWTLGPVLGSLVVTEVSSHTLDAHPDWRFQFYVCGIVGLVVFVIALLGLRELSPALRDQLMVSMRDRALIEARAAGLDPEQALKGSLAADAALRHHRLGVRDQRLPAPATTSLVGFLVVYFATTSATAEAEANALANWYWIANAIALVVTGVLSDRLRVRKPFMIVGHGHQHGRAASCSPPAPPTRTPATTRSRSTSS